MKRKITPIGLIYTSFLSLYGYLILWTPANAASIPDSLQKGLSNLWDKYWFYIAVFVSFGVLTGLLAFIILFIRLGANATNPQERSRIFKEMIAVAATTAALGGITFIVTLYLSFFS